VGAGRILNTTSAILIGVHVSNEDAKDLFGVVTRNGGVELEILFARISNKDKARVWKRCYDLEDGVTLSI
jgi:hypothetical protein